MYYIVSFQFQATPTNNAVPGPRDQVEIGYQMLIQERENNRIIQNQQEKAPENLEENVENNETAKESRRKSAEKRITFDLRQLKILEGYFQQGMTHPNADTKQLLAEELGISTLGQAVEVEAQSIQNWFQNRRFKAKNPEKDKKARDVLKEVEASSPEVIYVPNPDMNRSIGYQEYLRSQRNLNPYPQPVNPQVPQAQPAVMGFNPGLGAAINNFGLNLPQRPRPIPMQLPGPTRCPQGNPNPLPQPPNPQAQRIEPAVRGIQGGCPCHPGSTGPAGLHSDHCATQNNPNVVKTPVGESGGNPQNPAKPKRIRIAFSKRQVEILDNVYKENKYPENIRIQQLTLQLNLTFNNVQFWFKNRRRLDRVKEINNK
jgi:hypothetical protein